MGNVKEKISEILRGFRRVLIVSSKPTKEEFYRSLRICGIGTILIGLIGFIFYLLFVGLGV